MDYLTEEQLTRYRDRKVVVVNDNDQELGEVELIEAHRDGGIKHRAFSLVLFRRVNEKVEVLLQRRALVKPIFAGIWANTCCYNMAPGEEILARARSRVKEELGVALGNTELKELYQFSYEAEGENGWWENETDHVVVGECPQSVYADVAGIKPNPEEVADYKWMEWEEMKEEMKIDPKIYAPWWKMIVKDGRVEKYLGE